MIDTGILYENERAELIEGDILYMAAIGSHHAACVKRLNHLFVRLLSDRVIVGVQDPIHITENSEPEPDIVLLKPRADFYAEKHPEPKDVLLIVEVADTSSIYDHEIKVPLYANAGIRELWLTDLNEACLEVYTVPSPKGYKMLRKFHKGECLKLQAFPDIEIETDKIFG